MIKGFGVYSLIFFDYFRFLRRKLLCYVRKMVLSGETSEEEAVKVALEGDLIVRDIKELGELLIEARSK